jgi:hypothetical protein
VAEEWGQRNEEKNFGKMILDKMIGEAGSGFASFCPHHFA